MIETHIKGIPCKVEMTAGSYRKPDYDTWTSDWDHYGGWSDVEFEVYDRKGYKAKWLEKKMTAEDEKRIINELTKKAGEH